MIERVPRVRRPLLIALGPLLLMVLMGCRPSSRGVVPTFAPPATPGPAPSSTYTVTKGSIQETIESRGRVVAKQEAPLMFPLKGTLKAVHVAAGDEVEEEALLAELDAPAAEAELKQARFDLEQAKRDLKIAELQLEMVKKSRGASAPDLLAAEIALEKAEVQLANAEEEYQKALDRPWEPLEVTEGYSWTLQLSQWNYQLAQARLDQVRQSRQIDQQVDQLNQTIQALRVEQAEERVERARERTVSASEQLSDTRLLAPFSGLIVSLNKRAGDQVGSYETFGTIADPTKLRVLATVLEEKVGRIAVGQPVTTYLDAYPEGRYTGTVLQIADQTTAWQGQSAYEVTVGFDAGEEAPAALQMGADVIFAGRSREDVLVVPNRAVMVIGGQEMVEVIGEDGGIERVEVQTGITDGSQTEIVGGLREGQVVRIP